MSGESTEPAAGAQSLNDARPSASNTLSSDNGTPADPTKLTSDTLRAGDTVSEQLLSRLSKLEKYEHKLAEVARVYRNLNAARKAVEVVLKTYTPVQSISDTEELEAHLSNLNMKTQYAGEQIGALTDLDKTNRLKLQELEAQLAALRVVEQEKLALLKDMDKMTKERKVVEGQLERSNQKLKLDISALEAKQSELNAKLKTLEQDNQKLKESAIESLTAGSDPDALADKLSELISTKDDAWSAQSQNLAGLRQLLVEKCGAPQGFVNASELGHANESHAQEAAQLKDIMRKELVVSEERFKATTAERDLEVTALKEQLQKRDDEVAQRDAEIEQLQSAAPSDAMTAERVGDIIAAAISHRLVPEAVPEQPQLQAQPQLQPQSQNDGGGNKKKGKKKRRGTASGGVPNHETSPAAPAPAQLAAVAETQTAAEVVASRTEIDRLIALVETIAASSGQVAISNVGNVGNDSVNGISESTLTADKELAEHVKQAEQLRSTIDDLQAQLAELTKAAEVSQDENSKIVDQLSAKISQLEQDLQEAEAARDKLKHELDAKASEMGAATSALENKLAESLQSAAVEAKAQTDKHASTVEAVTEELASAKAQADKLPALRDQVSKSQSTVQRLEGELRACQDKLSQVESELAAAHKECALLKKSGGDAERERARLASTLAKVQAANARLEAQQKELQAHLDDERKRAQGAQGALEALDSEHVRALRSIETQTKATAEAERQLEEMRSTVAGLEEHVRAVDADLANSREQFAEKSRLLAQTTAQLQEMQYALEKERRTAKISAEDAAKELAGVRDQLAEIKRVARDQRSSDQAEMEKLRKQLGDVDQRASQASLVERLEAQQAEKEAALETLRSNLRRTEENQTMLQVEVDRLRDVERDFRAVKEQLDRVTEERKMSEQRWKRVHRDLKEEVRRLYRERQNSQSAPNASPALPLPSTSPPRQAAQQQQQQNQTATSGSNSAEASLPPSRSNSLTLASVSSLLRAATGNAAASTSSGLLATGAGRWAPAQTSSSSSLLGRPPNRASRQPSGQTVLEPKLPEETRADLSTESADSRVQVKAAAGSHIRSSSSAGSLSDMLNNDDPRSENVNIEYLRNVLFRFFNDKERRPQLVPVLSMLLNCKLDDIKHIQTMIL